MDDAGNAPCQTCWGSHGCDLSLGHGGAHQCGSPEEPCSRYNDRARVARYWLSDGGEWSEWMTHPAPAPGDAAEVTHGE